MESLVQLRQFLHQHPEVGYNEFETRRTLQTTLLQAGFCEHQFFNCAVSGFYVDVVGSGPDAAVAQCIALRTDLDALEMTEANEGLSYRSMNDGAAHMCGHDGHMASLIGAAIRLKQQEALIPSNCRVRLLFQPAEEIERGAEQMIEAGCLDGVDEVYGVHNMPHMTLGQFFCPDGPMLAAFLALTITIRGRGGHGAYPEKCQDVMLAMAQMLPALAAVTGRAISCHESAVFTICQVAAGSAINVMPSEAVLSGTLRTFYPTVKETVLGRIRAIVASVSAAFDCTAEIDILSDSPATVNHLAQAAFVRETIAECFGPEHVIVDTLDSGSEDFAFYTMKKPGAFVFVYSGKDDVMHSPDYDFTDELIPYICKLYLHILSRKFGVDLTYK
jgi:hippurate hydrolase